MTKKLPWLVMLIAFSGVLFAHGQTASSPTEQFVIGPGEVLVPQGVFLLVRNRREIGAVRFTNIEHGKVAGTGKASYESYFQGNGSGSLSTSNVEKHTGVIDLKSLNGIGRRSAYPGTINMWPYRGSEKDYGYEFAPTSARDVTEIEAADNRLHYYRFDRGSRVTLPVADLPK